MAVTFFTAYNAAALAYVVELATENTTIYRLGHWLLQFYTQSPITVAKGIFLTKGYTGKKLNSAIN